MLNLVIVASVIGGLPPLLLMKRDYRTVGAITFPYLTTENFIGSVPLMYCGYNSLSEVNLVAP
jgi:hypothetical protein